MSESLMSKDDYGYRIGDWVETGVYVCGEWISVYRGRIVSSPSSGLYNVDVCAGTCAAPWIHLESYTSIRLAEDVSPIQVVER